jgi:hypothetical protein
MRLVNLRQDFGIRQDASGEKFRIELDGQEFNYRGRCRRISHAPGGKIEARFGEDVRIGRFAGFDLFLWPGFNTTTEMVVRGSNSYGARVTDTAQGTILSLKATVQGFKERAERLTLNIADAQKRNKEIGAKFEREECFQELTRRQDVLRKNLISQRTRHRARPTPNQVKKTPKKFRKNKLKQMQDGPPVLRPLAYESLYPVN